MQRLLCLLALGWACCAAKQIDNQVIVVYKDTNECKSRGPDDLKQKAKGLIGKSKANADQDPELLFIYPSINGFAAKGVNKVKLDADPCVAFTEIDQTVQLDPPEQRRSLRGLQTTTTGTVPYGVTRVKGTSATSSYSGSNRAFVIDTGIQFNHPDLQVDTSLFFDVFNSNGQDQYGHGTHVSGTIAAKGVGVYGVAPGATLISVRVLDSSGSGTISGVMAGVNWIIAGTTPPPGRSGDVANMSLGGGLSQGLDQAVATAASKGISFALAAGNSGTNYINTSPAYQGGVSSTDNVYTVAAIDSSDRPATFSNYGSGVQYAEPGVNVYSTYFNSGYATLSGTSMATPHLTGMLLYGASLIKTATSNGNPVFVYGSGRYAKDRYGSIGFLQLS